MAIFPTRSYFGIFLVTLMENNRISYEKVSGTGDSFYFVCPILV
jgi:hypothetical protein